MALRKKITLSWSGGKDSALALYRILTDAQYEVVNLHTVFGRETRRVGLHGVSEALIEAQADSMKIPLVKTYLDESPDSKMYEGLIKSLYEEFRDNGISHIVFGDIFLEDLKEYREKLVQHSGLWPLFPLWEQDSRMLLDEFLLNGFKTIVCASNERCHSAGILGKVIDNGFVRSLPEDVDPCGENGEFHTFVFDGPLFSERIDVAVGHTISKQYEYFVKDENNLSIRNESRFYFKELSLRNSSKTS